MISSSAELGDEWVRLVKLQIDSWGLKTEDVDLLASHGQTILHQPDPENGLHTTLQIVDGDRLAAGTGIITVSDFRHKHIAAGYEGAPIVPLGEMLLFSDEEENRVLLNLGGIANFTWLPAGPANQRIIPILSPSTEAFGMSV